MQSMKAVRIHSYGGREVLVYEDAPMPQPGEGEVLVRVAASSVNPFDCAARSGYVVDYYPYAFPAIAGLDVAGVIESTGSSANGFAAGDAVYGRANPAKNGAYAEFIALPASQIAHNPARSTISKRRLSRMWLHRHGSAHQYRQHLSRANCTHPRCGRRRGHLRRAVR